MSASKSEGSGQPEDALVTFEKQSAGQNVVHGNKSSLTRNTSVKVRKCSSWNISIV